MLKDVLITLIDHNLLLIEYNYDFLKKIIYF